MIGAVADMRKKLVKHGNSRALVIDKALLEVLGIGEDASVQVSIVDGSLLVSAAPDAEATSDRFEVALERSLEKYADVYRKLAE